jgi:hypothetical protein
MHAVIGEFGLIARSCGFKTASDFLTPFIKLDLDEIAVCVIDTSAALSDRARQSRCWPMTAAWKQHVSSYETSVRVPVPFDARIPQFRLDALRFLALGFVKLVHQAAADSTATAIQFRRAVVGTCSLTVKDAGKQGGDGAAVTGIGNVLSSVMAGVLDLLRDPGVSHLDLIRLLKRSFKLAGTVTLCGLMKLLRLRHLLMPPPTQHRHLPAPLILAQVLAVFVIPPALPNSKIPGRGASTVSLSGLVACKAQAKP